MLLRVRWPARSISPGGTLLTTYDERDQPIEGQFRDAKGEIVSRMIFRYDANGNVISEEHTRGPSDAVVPEQIRGQLNDAQIRGLAAWMATNMTSIKISYAYDGEGRLIGKNTQGFVNEATTVGYNDHGDKALETMTSMPDPATGIEFGMDDEGNVIPQSAPKPQQPQESEARYEYQYDAQGNWIEMKVTHASKTPVPFQQSEIRRRELTYY